MKKILSTFCMIFLCACLGYSQLECKSFKIQNGQNNIVQVKIEVWDYSRSQGYNEYFNFNVNPCAVPVAGG